MKFYSDPKSIPLRFHRLFHYIGLPVTALMTVAQLFILLTSTPLQAFSLIIVAIQLICTIVCFTGLFHWRPSAWYALCINYSVRLLDYVAAVILTIVYDLGADITRDYAWQLVGALIASILVLYYYYKRRVLFFPPANPLAPSTWMDDNPNPESPNPTPKLEASVPSESNPSSEPVKTVIESAGSEPVSVSPVSPTPTTPPTPPTTVPPTAATSTATPTPVTSPDVNFQSPTVKIHRRPSISTILCIILAICCVGIGTFSAISISSYQEQLEEKTEQLKKTSQQLDSSNDLLLDVEEAMRSAWDYDRDAVYCPVEGLRYYHRSTCGLLPSIGSYYIYNTNLAEHRGYSPCPICSESSIEPIYKRYINYITKLKK